MENPEAHKLNRPVLVMGLAAPSIMNRKTIDNIKLPNRAWMLTACGSAVRIVRLLIVTNKAMPHADKNANKTPMILKASDA